MYELGIHKFYREAYSEAAVYFSNCKKLFKTDNEDDTYFGYCVIDESKLNGFCQACGISVDANRDLLVQFYDDTMNNYTNVINILQQDNIKREIPMAYRDLLESDLTSMLSCGTFTASRDLLLQIQTLNAVCRMMEVSPYPTANDFIAKLNISSKKGVEFLVKALKSVIAKASISDKEHIRLFLSSVFEKCDPSVLKELYAMPEIKMLFTTSEMEMLKFHGNDITELPNLSQKQAKDQLRIKTIGNPQLELRRLECQIVESYDAAELHECISKYLMCSEKPAGNINKWEVHISMETMIKTLPNSFIQQYSFIILAKVKELLQLQSFTHADELLHALEEEVKKHGSNASYRFCHLLTWEVLFCNILELECNWPAKYINCNTIVARCKLCMGTLQQITDINVVPRLEVMEQVIMTLLNLAEWEYITTNKYNKTFRYLELSSDIADSCLDIVKYKGTKKFSLGLWDRVLTAFLKGGSHSNNALPRSILMQFLSKMRDISVINVLLSLLIRLYNVLREDSSIELSFPYLHLWPSTINNAQAYIRSAIGEVLFEYVRQTLLYHPNNVPILKLLGDLNYAYLYYAAALEHYFEALIVVSDNFVRSISKTIIEDEVYRRMIKCCTALSCHTQAAVLCQFLDEIDYVTAFKCLSEANSSDAMDSYYECIWDSNILEFLIHLHSKRNEHYRKQQVVNIIGQLELNASNNDEIKREAANVRKLKFLRSMSKQYIISFSFS